MRHYILLFLKSIYGLIGLLGLMLLLLNISGFWLPLRNDAIYEEPKTNFANDIQLTEDELRMALEWQPQDTEATYAYRATYAVNAGIAHYWWPEKAVEYNLRVPPHENYILWYLGGLDPSYAMYEFADADKIIERGIGMCAQQALVLTDALLNRGIQARLVGLSAQHAVVVAIIDGAEWVLDPDYGVVLPWSLAAITANPERVRASYHMKNGSVWADWAVQVYGLPYTEVYATPTAYLHPDVPTIERWSYAGIWVIPIFCIGVSGLPRAFSSSSASRSTSTRRIRSAWLHNPCHS